MSQTYDEAYCLVFYVAQTDTSLGKTRISNHFSLKWKVIDILETFWLLIIQQKALNYWVKVANIPIETKVI